MIGACKAFPTAVFSPWRISTIIWAAIAVNNLSELRRALLRSIEQLANSFRCNRGSIQIRQTCCTRSQKKLWVLSSSSRSWKRTTCRPTSHLRTWLVSEMLTQFRIRTRPSTRHRPTQMIGKARLTSKPTSWQCPFQTQKCERTQETSGRPGL